MSEASQHTPKPVLTTLGLVAGLFLMTWVVDGLVPDDGLPPLGAERAQERKSTLQELRATSREQLSSYGVVNEANEVYRIPIDRAIEIVVREWRNPEEGREKMLARSERAFPEPAQSSPYE